MADHTKIEWTEATWNPITGCSVTSPGCTNCYAMKLAGTRLQHHESRKGLTVDSRAGPVWTGEVRFNEQWLDQPLRWKRPRMIFVCAHGDLFHESVPDEWIDRVFAVMALAPQHTFQVLTKRSARMGEYLEDDGVVRRICEAAARIFRGFYKGCIPEGAVTSAKFKKSQREYHSHVGKLTAWLTEGGAAHSMWVKRDGAENWRYPSWVQWPLPNVWLGVSVEDQMRADERIPDLLATTAAVRWLSCEPLLGAIKLPRVDFHCDLCGGTGILARWPKGKCHHCNGRGDIPAISTDPKFGTPSTPMRRIDWVVVGGESGSGARAMHPDWARSLRDQCAAVRVPFFFKQWGNHRPTSDANGEYMIPSTKKEAGRLLDGAQHDGFPEVAA